MATLSSVLLLLLLSHFSHVQLCATPKTHSPPGSPIPGILQAKTLEWVAIAFSGKRRSRVKMTHKRKNDFLLAFTLKVSLSKLLIN